MPSLKVAQEGLRWVIGAGGVSGTKWRVRDELGLPAVHAGQAGLISDMDYIADVLFGRTVKETAKEAVLSA